MDGFASTGLAGAEGGFRVIVVDGACAAWEEGLHAASLRGRSRYFVRIVSTGAVGSGIERRRRGRPRCAAAPRRTYWYATMLVAQSGSTTSAGRGMSKRMRLSANCGSATCSMQRRQ
jgi:hypothetical protein